MSNLPAAAFIMAVHCYKVNTDQHFKIKLWRRSTPSVF